MSSSAALLEAVREAARPGIWAQGVTLSRQGAVALDSQKEGEVELRVRTPGRPVPASVTLYTADPDWSCDCPGRVDPCEHVVAAVIALSSAQTQNAPLVRALQRTLARVAQEQVHARPDGEDPSRSGEEEQPCLPRWAGSYGKLR